MMSKLVYSLLILLFSSAGFALVDYSEPIDSPAVKKAPVRSAPKMNRAVKKSQTPSKGSNSPYGIEMKLGYENVKAEVFESSPRVSLYRASLHVQTPYSIFFDGSYFYGASDSPEVSDSSAEEPGNPEFKLGFNWLQFGGAGDAAAINLLTGIRLSAEDSPFASSGTNYFAGIETSKRFLNFALGLGYLYHITGAPSDKEELDTGNIHQVYGEFAWQATYDIIFSFEAGYYSIAASEDKDRSSALESNISFSYFTPKLNLTLAPHVSIDLGATFSGKKAELENYSNYKFWSYKGLYGDSLFANLIFSI